MRSRNGVTTWKDHHTASKYTRTTGGCNTSLRRNNFPVDKQDGWSSWRSLTTRSATDPDPKRPFRMLYPASRLINLRIRIRLRYQRNSIPSTTELVYRKTYYLLHCRLRPRTPRYWVGSDNSGKYYQRTNAENGTS